MMKAAIISAAFIAACLPVRDAGLEGAFAAATTLDWAQTNVITAKCRESNPVIGTCGEVVPPAVWFPFAMGLHYAVTLAIPEGFARTAWQSFTLGLEITTTQRNWIGGIRIAPPF